MKKLFEKYRELIVYVCVGLMATVISYGVRLGLLYGLDGVLSVDLQSDVPEMVAKASVFRTVCSTIGSLIAILASYIPNKVWVFRDYEKNIRRVWAQFGAFFGSRVISLVIEAGIAAGMPALLTLCGYKAFELIIDADADLVINVDADLVTTGFSIVFITILNYIVSKLLVFRKRRR